MERVREVEHGTFTPLVFSCTEGMGPMATVVYKRIASLLSEHSGQSYSRKFHWLRCKLINLFITLIRDHMSKVV